MKWAVLSDIHSNKVALDAVMDDLDSKEVDAILCAGDIVGYGPKPKECLELVRDKCDVVIKGNHDRTAANGDFEHYQQNNMAYQGLHHSLDELTDEQLNWLDNLDESVLVNDALMMVHSHPEVQDKYVPPRNFARMRNYMDNLGCMILGHTHIQHQAWVDERLIFNPGSVGQPRDGDNRSAYAVLTYDKGFSVEMNRVEYDIDEVASQIRSSKLPERTADRLYIGE
jgi:predicted phosphodiesterase